MPAGIDEKIMLGIRTQIFLVLLWLLPLTAAKAGPYTEVGVNGYVGPDRRHADPQLMDEDPNIILNPIFCGWATDVESYQPAPGLDLEWSDPNKALGPAENGTFGVVSLGDLSQTQIGQGLPPGQITLYFEEPNHIRQGKGYDFAVFENGFLSSYTTAAGSIAGQMFAELAYVEVSSDGNNFARFPAVSLTPALVGPYGTIEVSDLYNLLGKHPNAGSICTGTPFDLTEIQNDPNVLSGLIDVNNIRYVRIVDVPGSGDFYDSAVSHIDPNTWPYISYADNNPIYDAWLTSGSGGADLAGIGVLDQQQYSADINLDGLVNLQDFALFASAWQRFFGQPGWIRRCDLVETNNNIVDAADLQCFIGQWLQKENWCRP